MSLRERSLYSLSSETPIDWLNLITEFGLQHDMHQNEVLHWISNRTSLQIACEILGVTLSPTIAAKYTKDDLRILNSLGDVLFELGHPVPRLMENRRLQYVRKGREKVGFTLTREEYLLLRSTGKSKNKIAHEQGISGPALFHWLEKWNLKDAEVERQEISRLTRVREANPTNTTSSPDNEQETATDAVSETRISTSMSHFPRKSTRIHLSQISPVPSRVDTIQGQTGNETMNPNLHAASSEGSAAEISASGPAVALPLEFLLRPVDSSDDTMFNALLHGRNLDGLNGLSRDEAMQLGLGMLQRAIRSAHHDLCQLLGPEAADTQVSQFVQHQLHQFSKRTK